MLLGGVGKAFTRGCRSVWLNYGKTTRNAEVILQYHQRSHRIRLNQTGGNTWIRKLSFSLKKTACNLLPDLISNQRKRWDGREASVSHLGISITWKNVEIEQWWQQVSSDPTTLKTTNSALGNKPWTPERYRQISDKGGLKIFQIWSILMLNWVGQ